MSALSVSVVIPAYRAARTIGRAVDSLLAQTSQPDEVLIVDDGSPDDLTAPLAGYGDRVTLLRKTNGGAASARNLGIDRARGDLIAFLDADDYWEPHKLERQLDVFRRHPQVGLVASRWFTQDPGCERVPPPPAPEGYLDRLLVGKGEEAFRIAMLLWTSTVVVRREVLGDHPFVSGLEPAEDRDLWIRLVSTCPAYLVGEPLASYVQEPGSLCRTQVDRDYGNMLRVIRRHTGLLGPSGTRYWETKMFRQWAARHLGQGHPGKALAPAWERLRQQPFAAEGWWILLKSAALASLPSWLRKSDLSTRGKATCTA